MANASIFSQYLQPVRSVQDYAADLDKRDLLNLQLQGQQGQNALLALTRQQQMDQTQQAMQERAMLQRLAAQHAGNPDALLSALDQSGSIGLMKQADEKRKALADLAEKQAKAKSETATAGKTEYETEAQRFRDSVQHLGSFTNAADAIAGVQADPTLKPHQKDQMITAFQRVGNDPVAFQLLQLRMILSKASPEKQAAGLAPDVSMTDTGGAIVPTNKNPMAGPVGAMPGAAPIPVTQSPNNAATVNASLANAAALRDQAQATRDAAKIQTGFSNEKALRQEFEGLPEVKAYKLAYPAFAAIKDAATRDTPQADINIVYGIAKIFDPTSVVREGEYATVANSPNIPDRLKGTINYVTGGGRLTPEVKQKLIAEAAGRVAAFKAEHDKARGSYEGIAKSQGMNPASVFAAMGDAPQGPATSGTPSGGLSQAEQAELDALRKRFKGK